MSNQRILLVYPNERDMSLVPPVIGLFASLLRERGHIVSMFDSTGYDFEGKADSDVEAEKKLFNAPLLMPFILRSRLSRVRKFYFLIS